VVGLTLIAIGLIGIYETYFEGGHHGEEEEAAELKLAVAGEGLERGRLPSSAPPPAVGSISNGMSSGQVARCSCHGPAKSIGSGTYPHPWCWPGMPECLRLHLVALHIGPPRASRPCTCLPSIWLPSIWLPS
jgi:hypothetical protein